MLILILEWLKSYGFKVPAVFGYTSTRMMLAAITAFVITITIGPLFIRRLYALKIGQPIRSEEGFLLQNLHAKKNDTPTMGGVLIITAMLSCLVLWMDLKSLFTLILFTTTILMGLLGGYDDYLKVKYKDNKGLSSRKKILIQIICAAIIGLFLYWPYLTALVHVGSWFAPPIAKAEIILPISQYLTQLYIPFFKDPWILPSSIMYLLFIFVFTGSSNAVNLTDGLDGLATGSLIMVATALSLIAFLANNADIATYLNILYIEGSGEIATYLCALSGACLGFLWFNSHPAEIFMGDIGSLTLGSIIGVCACLLGRQLLLTIIGGLFVIETLSVILQVSSYRLRNKKRIFACAPLHHHFEYKGWPETKVVIRFWIISLLLGIVGIASLKFQ